MESLTSIKSDIKLPSVNSDDPNERKLARRLRIERRLKAVKKQQDIEEGIDVESEEEKKNLLEEAIETSEDTLQQLYLEGKELVTNVMVASDAKEVARREAEAEERNNRLDKLKKESADALQKLDEISSQWNKIMEINGPLELYQHMKEQKAKCLDLIEEKNDLIKGFQMELKLTDEKFIKGQKAMCEELALLTKRIDEQVLVMKRAYRLELNNIEESVNASREEMLNDHRRTWLSLYKQRDREEISNIESKFALVENFHEELHKLHVDHEEKFRATRINYETDIQILEQELEEVKSLCLLNSEKLDYNYQVLKKRQEENAFIKNHQRRRLNKLQDTINDLKKKLDEKKEAANEEYKKLTKDVEKYYAKILDIERKAELFSRVNSEKFENIWDMKDEEAKGLMNMILSADKVIHEQILGLNWTPPPNTNFTKKDLTSYKAGVFATQKVNKKKNSSGKKVNLKLSKDLREGETVPEVLEGHNRLLHHIFELIADQTGFLMEEKLEELLSPYTEDEKTFVRLDNVFVAIGIRTEKDIEEMKKVFIPYTVCLLCDRIQTSGTSIDLRVDDIGKWKGGSRQQSILQIRELEEKVSKLRLQAKKEIENVSGSFGQSFTEGSDSQPNFTIKESESSDNQRSTVYPSDYKSESRSLSDKSENQSSLKKDESSFESDENDAITCNITHPLVIEKYYVLKALRDFVSIYHAEKLKPPTGIEEKLNHKRITISRLMTEEEIVSYWGKYREIISPELEFRWNGVFLALTKYLAVLQRRHELNVKVKAVRRQNLELKRLLSYYKISDEKLKLPKVLPLPNEPLSILEIETIFSKLY